MLGRIEMSDGERDLQVHINLANFVFSSSLQFDSSKFA